MAISQGNYTVGEDTTYTSLDIALQDLTNLTGNVTFMITNINSIYTKTNLNIDLNGYTLTIKYYHDTTLDYYHNGSFATVYNARENYCNVDLGIGESVITFSCTSSSAGGKILIYGHKFVTSGTSNTYSIMFKFATGTNVTNYMYNCIFYAITGRNCVPIMVNSSNTILKCFNCTVIDGLAANSQYAIGFLIWNSSTSTVIENCTAYNFKSTGTGIAAGFANYSKTAITLKNFASIDCTNDYVYDNVFYQGLDYTNASKCASTMSNGTDLNLNNLTSTDHFVSLTSTNVDFLKLKSTSILCNAGTTTSITENTAGIRRNVRPRGGSYSIGSDESIKRKINAVFPLKINGISIDKIKKITGR